MLDLKQHTLTVCSFSSLADQCFSIQNLTKRKTAHFVQLEMETKKCTQIVTFLWGPQTNRQTFIQTNSRSEGEEEEEDEEEEEEEEGTFLKDRAGRAGGRSLTWWWKASKCIDRCCPTGGDTAGLTERQPQTREEEEEEEE